MIPVENPIRHLSYLQQCLSSNKKPLGLFLGAGCPTAVTVDGTGVPLIPAIAGITRAVREKLASSAECERLLERVDRNFQEDAHEHPSVEDMLTHVRALRAVAGKAEVRGLSAATLDRLDETICTLIYEVVDKVLPAVTTAYHSMAAWIAAISRANPVEIFTSNYDLLIEQALEARHVPYFDGFAGVREPFFDLRAMEEDMLPPRWARLWKLHGSINWYQVADRGVFRGTSKNDKNATRIIHPSHLKYQESRRMPYLAMIDRLRAFLRRPAATLVICGYSFRDQHINEAMVHGLRSTPTGVAFGLLHGRVAQSAPATALARGCPNLSILARDGGVISTQACAWPEKEAAAVSSGGATGIVWVPSHPACQSGGQRAEFTLGDFGMLGQFLQELAGNVRHQPEPASA